MYHVWFIISVRTYVYWVSRISLAGGGFCFFCLALSFKATFKGERDQKMEVSMVHARFGSFACSIWYANDNGSWITCGIPLSHYFVRSWKVLLLAHLKTALSKVAAQKMETVVLIMPQMALLTQSNFRDWKQYQTELIEPSYAQSISLATD